MATGRPAAIVALLLVTMTLVFAGCASAGGGSTGSNVAPSTTYYYGTSSTTSPDGRIPYGPPVMTLVRRDVVPSQGTIVESVTRDGRTVVTTLRQEQKGRFSAIASDNSVEGAVELEGEEWRWTSWRYTMGLTDGSGTVEGSGKLDGKWLETDRVVVAGNGERRARTTDRLTTITVEEYERRLAEMSAPASKRR